MPYALCLPFQCTETAGRVSEDIVYKKNCFNLLKNNGLICIQTVY